MSRKKLTEEEIEIRERKKVIKSLYWSMTIGLPKWAYEGNKIYYGDGMWICSDGAILHEKD